MIPLESEFFMTSKINSVGSFSSWFAATREIIVAYVKSTSSLNPPLDLNPSIILKSTVIESLIFAKFSNTYWVVLIIAKSYDFVISIKTPSQSK